jgi:hypothetical protein
MKITQNYHEVKNIMGKEVLATPEYFHSLGAINWGYFIEDDCVLPFYIKRKYIFKYLSFTTGIISTSIITFESLMLCKVFEYIKNNLSIDFILCQHVTALFNAYPAKSIHCSFGSYVIDLSLNEENLLSKMHSKHRNVIKKAEKDGVRISCVTTNKRKCIDLIRSTLSRQGIRLHAETLEKLSTVPNADYWVAEYNEEVHGAAIILWGENRTAYYMYGGSILKPHSGAMNLLHWTAIKKMKECNVKYYDFVGARINPDADSKYEGIQRFKSRFGGELKKGFLLKYPINTFKYKLYDFLLLIKNKGHYYGDIIDQEYRRGNI